MADSALDVRGAFNDLNTNAKRSFVAVEAESLRKLIDAAPEVVGSAEISEVKTLIDGAGASNGITFFKAVVDVGKGPRTGQYVARYNPGVALLKQKSFADEYKTVKAVAAAGLSVPKVFWLDADGSLLGAPGYIAERVKGEAPASGIFEKGLFADATPEARHRMMLAAAEFHGQLRRTAIGPDQVPHLVGRGVGAAPVERELRWWLRELELAHVEEAKQEDLRGVVKWLTTVEPVAYEPGLIHGDAQFANVMYDGEEISAVLDWELSYLGHNESDLALMTFCAETQNVDGLGGVPSENEFISAYEKASGFPVVHWEFFKCVNAFKWVAAISLSAANIPNFDAVWGVYRDHLAVALKRAGGV